jgi:hypothetical protein
MSLRLKIGPSPAKPSTREPIIRLQEEKAAPKPEQSENARSSTRKTG